MPVEDGAMPVENARSKARAVWSASQPFVFADEAGLEINALDGAPGVRGRRWNGALPADVDDASWLEFLLRKLRSVPMEARTARFRIA